MAAPISAWLASEDLQCPEGLHSGAIAGWLDDGRHPLFYYGEITGYYLTCEAFARAAHHGETHWTTQADAARAWLVRMWSRPPMQTRYYVAESTPDWRNDAMFSFDLAMMMRGLSFDSGANEVLCRRNIAKAAEAMIAPEGDLRSHVPHRVLGPEFPRKWSTQPGPFAVKTAASLLSARDPGPRLRAAAYATFERWHAWYAQHEIAGDLHPLLYHLEGMVILSTLPTSALPIPWEQMGDVFERMMRLARPNGDLPPAVEAPQGPARSDVIAQALRMGAILIDRGVLAADVWLPKLGLLAARLRDYVDARGGVRFTLEPGAPVHVNVWAGIFAFQAYVMFERVRRGRRIDDELLRAIA